MQIAKARLLVALRNQQMRKLETGSWKEALKEGEFRPEPNARGESQRSRASRRV